MKDDKYSLNISGLRITSEEAPYLIKGSPIRSGESMHSLGIQVEDNIASYTRMSHTTSIDIMKQIFAKKTFRSSCLSSAKLNDRMEKQRVGVSQFAGSRFITCFTHNIDESIPFWSHYGGSSKTKKVQLQFKNFTSSISDFIYTDYALVADGKKVFYFSDEYTHTININGIPGRQLGLRQINTDYDLSNCIRTILIFDLKYEPVKSEVFNKDYSSEVSIGFGTDSESKDLIPGFTLYEPDVLGRYKSKPWDYERETRIMCTLDIQDFSKWEFIDLRLKDEVFRDLIIILSPWADDFFEEEVKGVIFESELSVDIKRSIKIEHSVVEGTLNF